MGANAKARDQFAEEVRMWVFEEEVDGRKLTEIINTDHENVKYLPGRCGRWVEFVFWFVGTVQIMI